MPTLNNLKAAPSSAQPRINASALPNTIVAPQARDGNQYLGGVRFAANFGQARPSAAHAKPGRRGRPVDRSCFVWYKSSNTTTGNDKEKYSGKAA